MSGVKDIAGLRFGRLTVIERVGNDRHGRAEWKCLCDCGEVRVCKSNNLRRGRTNSCGCLREEVRHQHSVTHGKRKSRLYSVWADMKNRCYNPKIHNYHRYGGRGITVCDEWRNDFRAFYEWAMASGYDENAPRGRCTIDRIDNDKGYSPDNCRWVDTKTQNGNRSNSKKEKNNERNQNQEAPA